MKLTREFSRVSALFGLGEGDPDEEFDRDPEMDEELWSRDWPEASKPLKGGRLKWKVLDDHWSTSRTDHDLGPKWGTDTPRHYRIWATRKYNENWGGDYYTYDFMAKVVFPQAPTKGRKKKVAPQTESKVLGSGDTLAEAQQICEQDAKGWFEEDYSDVPED